MNFSEYKSEIVTEYIVADKIVCFENCLNLVKTHEKTGTPYMFMENCCFGKDELFVTSLVRRGLFGEIVHCSGAYGHDLRKEISYGIQNRHYRFKNYLYRNLENYPTHELGPITKILNINRGNKILQSHKLRNLLVNFMKEFRVKYFGLFH